MIYLGSDHGGYELKTKLKKFLDSLNLEYKDVGNSSYDKDDDYPDYAFAVAQKVSSLGDTSLPWSERAKGILLCRSAGGIIMAANKIKGVIAIAVTDVKSAKHSREHNDANVIGLSGDWISDDEAEEIVKVWLNTEFSNEKRHIRRLNKIKKFENEN